MFIVLIRVEELDRIVSVVVSFQVFENFLGIMQYSVVRIDIKFVVVDYGVIFLVFIGLLGSNSYMVGKDCIKLWIGMFQCDLFVGGLCQIVSRSKV